MFELAIALLIAAGVLDIFSKKAKEEERRRKEASQNYNQTTVLTHYPNGNVRINYFGARQPTINDSTPPPEVCTEAVDAMYSDIRQGYQILSDYYGIPQPAVVFDSRYLESQGLYGLQYGNTIYLKNRPHVRTCLHEFYHYLARCRGLAYSRAEESSAENFASQFGF